jgi:AcrR family transcriptional regulator
VSDATGIEGGRRRGSLRKPPAPSRSRRSFRKQQPRGELRRQQILDAAVELFSAKGYRGTGLAALAERVGMTATGMLYYFGTKERMLQEVVAERDRRDPAWAVPGPLIPNLGSLSLTSFRDLGRHNAETAVLTRLYVVLGAESFDPDDPLHEFFVKRYETARTLVRSVLEREVEEGQIRSDVDVDQISMEIIAVMMGLEIQWLMDPTGVDLPVAVESYFDRLVADLSVLGFGSETGRPTPDRRLR